MSVFLQELKQYPFRTRIKLLIIIVLASVVHLMLKIFDFKTIIKILSKFYSRKENLKPGVYLRRYSKLMASSYRLKSRFYNCLSLSVVFWFLLSRHGVNVNIKFGMRKEKGKMHFHSWLQYNGRNLASDNDVDKYISFDKPIV